MTRYAVAAFFLLATVFSFSPVAAGESPLARPVRLNLWGASLTDTAAAIRDQTGVEVLFYLPDLPPDTTSAPDVYLMTGDVPLGTALEALARRFAFRFRVTRQGKVEISRGYRWAGNRQGLRIVRTPPITETGDDAALLALLREMIKPLSLLDGDFAIRFEAYPLPGDPHHKRGTVVMPDALAGYVQRAVRCLGGDPGDYPPRGETPALFARAREYGTDWEGLLSRQFPAPTGRDIRSVLADTAMRAGCAIVLQEAPERNDVRLPADMDRYTLGRLCELLATDSGLGKRVVLPCGAIVFESRGAMAVEMDSRSRELYWDGLAVAGFDVRGAVARMGSAGAVMAVLRRDVFPGVWRDPVCGMVYSPAFGRLAVVAPVNVLPGVADRLARLVRD